MQWIKTNIYKLFFVFIIVFYFSTNLVYIGREEVNPDAVNWHYRTQQFINGLKYFQLEKTYQHYHPGVTLMWVSAPAIEITRQVLKAEYSTSNFLAFHTNVKVLLVSVNALLISICAYFIYKLRTIESALAFCVVLIAEPFFIANTRMFHMDALFTLLTFLSLLLFYYYTKNFNLKYLFITSLVVAFSILTRSIGIGLVAFFIGYSLFIKKIPAKYVLGFILLTFALCFVFFPALWVSPLDTITSIFSEADRIGLRDGHEQIFFGKLTANPGIWFYPLVLLMKVSPVVWILLLLFIYQLFKNYKDENISFIIYMTLFYLGYFAVMSYASKKLDRYMLVLFPYICFSASQALTHMRYKIVGFVLIGLVSIFTSLEYAPYYFTYTSPIFGSPENANKIVAQKPFGIGMVQLEEMLIANYGEVDFGFIDTKPMKAIYSNSKVHDIRITSSDNYDVLVLATNEDLPMDSPFQKDNSLYINGLEYWRIYTK